MARVQRAHPLRRLLVDLAAGQRGGDLLLLDAGASVTQVDEENRSPLHLAMQHCGGVAESAASVPLLQRLLQLQRWPERRLYLWRLARCPIR